MSKRKFNLISEPDKVINPDTGRTRLIDAIVKNDLQRVEELLQAAANPNKPDKDGRTPLHHAARWGLLPVMERLLDAGAQINPIDSKSRTPLAESLSAGNALETVEFLLKEGASADIADKTGRIPLHHAAENGTPEMIAAIFRATGNPDQKDKTGVAPVQLAAEKNTQRALQVFVFERADLKQSDNKGDSLLHIACGRAGGGAIAEYLLTTEAGVMAGAVNVAGRTPLHIAVETKQENLLTPLITNGAPINLMDKAGYAPLHIAIESGSLHFTALLADLGADIRRPPGARDKKGALNLALRSVNGTEIVKFLVGRGAAVNAQEESGMTPLMVAVEKNLDGAVDFLLDQKADVTLTDKMNRNVLHHVGNHLLRKTVEKLITTGAQINQPDTWGRTPLLIGVQDHKTALCDILLAKKADPNVMDQHGNTALLDACRRNKTYFIERLIDAGANVNVAERHSKETPLQMASFNGLAREVEKMLAKGADPLAQDGQGRTALHRALQNFSLSLDTIKVLLKHGADPLKSDQWHTTPYDLARNGHKGIVLGLFDENLRKKGRIPPRRPPPPGGGMAA